MTKYSAVEGLNPINMLTLQSISSATKDFSKNYTDRRMHFCAIMKGGSRNLDPGPAHSLPPPTTSLMGGGGEHISIDFCKLFFFSPVSFSTAFNIFLFTNVDLDVDRPFLSHWLKIIKNSLYKKFIIFFFFFLRLFEAEEQDLFTDLQSLPRNAALRKLNDLIKRARLAKVRRIILSKNSYTQLLLQ